jgi:PAS domain S-box-containing protein
MKFNIKNKIFLLVLFSVLGTVFISSYIYLISIKNFAKENALKNAQHDLKILQMKVAVLKMENERISNRLINNNSIKSSLNLISNYQDIKNYDRAIFDAEKQNSLNILLNILGENTKWSAAIFDINENLVVVKRNKGNKTITGYSVFENEKLILYNNNKKIKSKFQPTKLNLNSINKFEILELNNEILLRKTLAIKLNSKTIGYLRIASILNKYNYTQFISGVSDNISLVSKDFSLNTNDLNTSYDKLNQVNQNILLEQKDNFILVQKMKFNKNILIVAHSNKKQYNKYISTMVNNLIKASFIISIIILLLTSIFTSHFITKPLYKLLEGIKRLKNKEQLTINIKSDDEISILAKEFNDISKELKSSFDSLENSNLLLQNVLDTVPMSIFIKNTQGNYILANQLFLDDCKQRTKLNIIGKNDYELWTKEEAQKYISKDNEVINTLQPAFNFEETQTINGIEKIHLTSKIPLLDKDKNTIGILGVYKDITDEKKTQEELKNKEKYLMQQSRLAQMGEMISMIAHQWRQPLAAISSTTNSLLLKSIMNKYESDYFNERLQNISDYSQHLSSTIDDFRNFFKKNKEKREITLENIADDSLKITQTALENKNIQIIKEYNNKDKISTYPNELRQVVLNLIKNAEDALIEKDIDDKYIKIKSYKHNNTHILEVSDNAGGIKDENIDKIFEPYFSTKKNKDGTGLGLYMSKSIIEDHCKGKITVSNNKNGAVFKVEI